jgi:YVTN family beta-propeller protein
MSDLVTELRREVVGAHAAHTRRRSRSLRLRGWRPALAAAAVAAGLVAVVAVIRSLPAPEPAEPRVVDVLRIGGIPVDGVFAGGSLWVTDSTGNQVIRIDPAKRRVVARIPLGASPEDITAGAEGVWVRAAGSAELETTLSRIDAESGRVVARARTAGGGALVAGGGALWVSRRFSQPESVDRLDAESGRIRARVPINDSDGLAVGGASLWVVRHDGTVLRVDAASGRIARRQWPELAPSSASADSSEAVVADARGAWVLSTENAKVFRLEGDHVARTLDVDATALPILARARDGLWIAAGDEIHGYRVTRISPRSGTVTASVGVGFHRPRAIVPVRGGLWVVGGDGTAVLVET